MFAAYHKNGGRPQHFIHRTTNFPKKTKVFLRLRGDGTTFSLKFLDGGKIDGAAYNNLLRYNCVPQFKKKMEGLFRICGGSKMAHRTNNVARFLDDQFKEKVLGMGSVSGWDWSARSPDLNPLEFFCWGYVKSKVFIEGGRPPTMADL